MATNAELQAQVDELTKQLAASESEKDAAEKDAADADAARQATEQRLEQLSATALSPAVSVGNTAEPALVEKLVLADGVSIAEDADGKKVRRYNRGDKAMVRPENVEYLESIYAVAKDNYTPEMGYPSVLQQVLAANRVTQAEPAQLVATGAVQQAEDESSLDDGGAGSTDNSVPASEKQADEQNQQ